MTWMYLLEDAHPETPIEIWAMDEHRIGLQPILRRVWARRGQRPIARIRPRYQWLYLYGFVAPQSGQTEWWVLPIVRTDVFSQILAAFAQSVGAGKDKQVLLVLDGAGWHRSPKVQVPDGIHLVWLPPYSPELQPAEHLWQLTNEPLLNRSFQDLDELEALQCERCRHLQSMPTTIRQRTLFHWWARTG
jgi:hypothetical protein